MRALIQRVLEASVDVQGAVAGRISSGLLVFAGTEDSDTDEDLEWTAGKILRMRILDDENKVCLLYTSDSDLMDRCGDVFDLNALWVKAL